MPHNLLSTLLTIGKKCSKAGLFILKGRPRYVKGKLPVWQQIVFAK
jgi:hypothetical protein